MPRVICQFFAQEPSLGKLFACVLLLTTLVSSPPVVTTEAFFTCDGSQLVTEDRVKAKKLSAKERSASQAGNYIIYLSSNF